MAWLSRGGSCCRTKGDHLCLQNICQSDNIKKKNDNCNDDFKQQSNSDYFYNEEKHELKSWTSLCAHSSSRCKFAIFTQCLFSIPSPSLQFRFNEAPLLITLVQPCGVPGNLWDFVSFPDISEWNDRNGGKILQWGNRLSEHTMLNIYVKIVSALSEPSISCPHMHGDLWDFFWFRAAFKQVFVVCLLGRSRLNVNPSRRPQVLCLEDFLRDSSLQVLRPFLLRIMDWLRGGVRIIRDGRTEWCSTAPSKCVECLVADPLKLDLCLHKSVFRYRDLFFLFLFGSVRFPFGLSNTTAFIHAWDDVNYAHFAENFLDDFAQVRFITDPRFSFGEKDQHCAFWSILMTSPLPL